jgi:hypothetical protein
MKFERKEESLENGKWKRKLSFSYILIIKKINFCVNGFGLKKEAKCM